MQNHISIAGKEDDKRAIPNSQDRTKQENSTSITVWDTRIHVLLWANEMGAKERYQEYKYENKFYMYLE